MHHTIVRTRQNKFGTFVINPSAPKDLIILNAVRMEFVGLHMHKRCMLGLK
jgi:hypothetical protein